MYHSHGAIVVVRGGKVIGQGFNEARSGFDGGALKTGSIAGGPLKLKGTTEGRLLDILDGDFDTTKGVSHKSHFPFENVGGGNNINAPLTMHSEMMAILSTLSDSATMLPRTTSSEKAYFKQPGLSKRKAILRDRGLKIFTKAVIYKAVAVTEQFNQECGSAEVQKWHLEEQHEGRGAERQGQGPRDQRAVSSIEECRERPSIFAEESSSSSFRFSPPSSPPTLSPEGSAAAMAAAATRAASA